MKKNIAVFILSLILTTGIFSQEYNWYKGNTHCHSTNSDGNVPPEKVVQWYKNHNYNFLVISDHNFLTDTKSLDIDPDDSFILIPGDEVSDSFDKKPIHIVGINIQSLVLPQSGHDITSTLQNNIDAIKNAGGISQIAHPNFGWAFTDKEMLGLKNVKLFEVYNFHPSVNNHGGLNSPSTEKIWDNLLSKGKEIFGIITDDTHNYTDFTRYNANPGRGWVVVKSQTLSPETVTDALFKGDFYSSSGVELNNISITDKVYRIDIKQRGSNKYITRFIGKNGKILKETDELSSEYIFKGNEYYVRAKILSSSGNFALTQPVFIK